MQIHVVTAAFSTCRQPATFKRSLAFLVLLAFTPMHRPALCATVIVPTPLPPFTPPPCKPLFLCHMLPFLLLHRILLPPLAFPSLSSADSVPVPHVLSLSLCPLLSSPSLPSLSLFHETACRFARMHVSLYLELHLIHVGRD